ncbi:tRNA1(Val) (adenine(37)-N6)-methyltransferase [Vibrio fluvialis]
MKSSTLKTKGFKFKQFAIEGGQSGMPVSTDGVMLGAWAFSKPPQRILDIGTGTGLLALMCAQRFPNAQIEAVDIDPHAFAAASCNAQQSPWSARIHVSHQDILATQSNAAFDAIICNPPYFNDGQQSQHAQRATARHTDTLNHSDLLGAMARLLAPEGKASLILPIVEGEQLITLATQQGWHLARRCDVQPSARKPVHRLLFELQRDPCQTQLSTLIIQDDADYSADFIALTRAFYLKM